MWVRSSTCSHLMPSERSAPSMTSVSSEASRSRMVVRAFGQRGQQQGAVGDALRARQAHHALACIDRLEVEMMG